MLLLHHDPALGQWFSQIFNNNIHQESDYQTQELIILRELKINFMNISRLRELSRLTGGLSFSVSELAFYILLYTHIKHIRA